MNKVLNEKLIILKEKMNSDPRVIELNKIENELNNSDEVMKLAYKKDMAVIDFEDALKHFGEKSNEAKEAQKVLANAKLELDKHPLVIKYNKAYQEVRLYYEEISQKLFGEFNLK